MLRQLDQPPAARLQPLRVRHVPLRPRRQRHSPGREAVPVVHGVRVQVVLDHHPPLGAVAVRAVGRAFVGPLQPPDVRVATLSRVLSPSTPGSDRSGRGGCAGERARLGSLSGGWTGAAEGPVHQTSRGGSPARRVGAPNRVLDPAPTLRLGSETRWLPSRR